MGSLIWLVIPLIHAQLQSTGKPYGIDHQMKSADVMYILPSVDPYRIEAEMRFNAESNRKSLRFALPREVDLTPSNNGNWVQEGVYRIWRVHILSPDAWSVGIIFKDYNLIPGVRLFLYDPDLAHVKGAYTSANNKRSGVLATSHIPGDEVVVEMQIPSYLPGFGSLRIESVLHAFLPVGLRGRPDDDRFGRSEPCEIDINCEEGSDWQQAKGSVVRIQTPSQYCTGVLVNNTAYDATPYVITAEHCIHRQETALATVFVFHYESAACFGEDGSVELSISGSDLLTAGDSVDFSLVRLSLPPPDTFGVYYAGWDRSILQKSWNATIHHPMGDVQKISYDFQAPSTPASIDDLPNADLRDYQYHSFWWIKQWDIGSTEGGSSGAPLFNSRQRLIGMLSGGKAKCGMAIGYDSITGRTIFSKVPNKNDYFTKFTYAWDYDDTSNASVKSWLDPLGTNAFYIEGFDPVVTPYMEEKRNHHFLIYPNPVSERLVITPVTDFARKKEFRIYDLSARVRFSGTLEVTDPTEISTGSLEPGVYLLEIDLDENRNFYKIVVAR